MHEHWRILKSDAFDRLVRLLMDRHHGPALNQLFRDAGCLDLIQQQTVSLEDSSMQAKRRKTSHPEEEEEVSKATEPDATD